MVTISKYLSQTNYYANQIIIELLLNIGSEIVKSFAFRNFNQSKRLTG